MKDDERLTFAQGAVVVTAAAQLRSVVVCLSCGAQSGSAGLDFELAADRDEFLAHMDEFLAHMDEFLAHMDEFLAHMRETMPPGTGESFESTAGEARRFLVETLRACLDKLEGRATT